MSPLLSTFASASARGWNPGVAGVTSDMELISTTILGSSAASVVLSSIPSTYKHLQLRFTVRTDNAATQAPFYVRLNGDSGTNYSRHWLRGDGATMSANAGSAEAQAWLGYALGAGDTASAFTNGVLDIVDYANTTNNKTLRLLAGSTGGTFKQIGLWSGGWYNTSAVNSVTFLMSSGNLVAGSRFSVYGIKG